jgi:hypothetical protein
VAGETAFVNELGKRSLPRVPECHAVRNSALARASRTDGGATRKTSLSAGESTFENEQK